MIISSQGYAVTYLDKNYVLTQHRLSDIMELARYPPSDPAAKKLNERLLSKLKYCKEVLVSIHHVSKTTSVGQTENQGTEVQQYAESDAEDNVRPVENVAGNTLARQGSDGERGGRFYH